MCQVSLISGRCSECAGRGSKCDLVVTAKDWEKLDADKARLERKLLKVEERSSELHAKRLRLRKQLGLLSSREKEIFSRELASIEELEKLEREEEDRKAAEVRQASTPITTSRSRSFDLSAFDFGSPFLSDPFTPAFSDDTIVSAPSNSLSS